MPVSWFSPSDLRIPCGLSGRWMEQNGQCAHPSLESFTSDSAVRSLSVPCFNNCPDIDRYVAGVLPILLIIWQNLAASSGGVRLAIGAIVAHAKHANLGRSTMTEKEIREAINSWSKGGIFRQKNFGDRVSIRSTAKLVAFFLRLDTEYEERSVSIRQTPRDGKALDNQGRPPDPHKMSVPKPERFENQRKEIPIPHTEHESKCTICQGEGTIICQTCRGSGYGRCPFCFGTGGRNQQQPRQVFQGGKFVTVYQSVYRPCTCMGGRVRCSCQQGRVTCKSCRGAGAVIVSQLLEVQFLHTTWTELFNTTPVPDELLQQGKGITVCDQDAPKLSRGEKVAADVDSHIEQAIQQSHAQVGQIVHQHLRVDAVAVHQIEYEGPEIKSGKLWIYGIDNAVHAPTVPARGGWIGSIFQR